MLRLRIGRLGADPTSFGSTWDNDDPTETISQQEWEESEAKKRLWVAGIATAIIALLALKP